MNTHNLTWAFKYAIFQSWKLQFCLHILSDSSLQSLSLFGGQMIFALNVVHYQWTQIQHGPILLKQSLRCSPFTDIILLLFPGYTSEMAQFRSPFISSPPLEVEHMTSCLKRWSTCFGSACIWTVSCYPYSGSDVSETFHNHLSSQRRLETAVEKLIAEHLHVSMCCRSLTHII